MFSQKKQQAVLSGQGRILCPKLHLLQRSVLYENNLLIICVRNRYWVATPMCTKGVFPYRNCSKNIQSSLKKETGRDMIERV